MLLSRFSTLQALAPRHLGATHAKPLLCNNLVSSSAMFPKSTLIHVQAMGKRTIGKPHPRVHLSATGDITIRTEPLRQKYKWKTNEINRLLAYLDQSASNAQNLPEIERLPTLQNHLNDYIRDWWGKRMAIQRTKARLKRRLRLKRRANLKIDRKMMFWQRVEDIKEQKVLRDQAREGRVERAELFSFKKFLAQYKEAHRLPPIIHDQDTFEKILQEKINTQYIRGPASAFRIVYPRATYKYRFKRDVVDPIVYELKKKAFVTDLIRQREQAIRDNKAAQLVEQRRIERAQLKAEKSRERHEHWNKILTQWHVENARLKALKNEYAMAREAIYAESRKEFLHALNTTVHLWNETPDECKFLRFKFGEGVEFPFNNTSYR